MEYEASREAATDPPSMSASSPPRDGSPPAAAGAAAAAPFDESLRGALPSLESLETASDDGGAVVRRRTWSSSDESIEARWQAVKADLEERRRSKQKALKTLGIAEDAFERRKALEVLGLTEEDFEEGKRYFLVPQRNAISLPSLSDAEAAHGGDGGDDADFAAAAAAAAGGEAAAGPRHVTRPSSAGGWANEPLTPTGIRIGGAVGPAVRFGRRVSAVGPVVVRPKAVRVLGMDDTQVRRIKALAVLGIPDYEVEEDTSRALARLGVKSPRDRARAARSRSPPS